MVLLSFRGTKTGWRNEQTGVSKLSNGKCQVLQPGKNNPMQQYMLVADWLESSFAEHDLGIVLDIKFTMNQQCALVVKVASSFVAEYT